jgi:hypothetical protein
MVSRQRASRWFQYLYFLRFSLLAWFFLILLCLLDLGDVTSTFTRGIMTLDSGWQVFHAAFFVVALHMTVLITARNTVRNGKSRFRSSVPPRLCVALTSSSAKAVWTVLAIAHIPTCLTLAYLGYTAYKEEEQYTLPLFGTHSWNIWFFFLFGIAAAFFFWYVVSLFYHWTYRSSPKSPAALVFPEEIFGDTAVVIPPPRLICWIDRLTRFVLKNFTFPGYAETPTGPLWELHFFSSISLLGIFLLYLFLYPITAPILRPAATRVGVLMALLTTILFEIGIYNASTVTADPTVKSRWAPYVKRIFQAIPAVFFLLFVYAVGYDISHKAVRLEMAFPTLASILVIANFFLWLFAGASFFFDRYRIPVLTAVLLLIFVPKVTAPYLAGLLVRLHLPWLAQSLDLEHYYTVHNLDAPATPPIPSDVLALRAADLTEPYIVVTASGGGIQAAEWTSQVMASLERRFADAHLQSSGRTPYTFHDHLLLASGVSGGSLGLMPYLLEYTAANPAMPFPSNDGITNRITNPSACSSLEAVAWGLAYYDLYRLLFTFRLPLPEVLTPDTAPDRTWALTAAFNRNLHDRHCGTDPDSLKGLPTISDGDGMTLASSADMLRKGTLPAFTFNTTAAETGGRFLLSNYWVPSDSRPYTDFIAAESFLQAYAQDNPYLQPKHFADISLATAARLSATFPYVSSGTRIPSEYTQYAHHFLDGGYYDNDGTASVIEFLKSALGTSQPAAKPEDQKLKILLIEIRDDDGTSVVTNQDDLASQNGSGQSKPPKPWTTLSQLDGPLIGLWNAGHESISRRNRRELCLLETAYEGSLVIHHVVFTIPKEKDKISSLSWNLTTRQRNSIIRWVKGDPTQQIIDQSVAWANLVLHNQEPPEQDRADTCTAWVQPATDPTQTAATRDR